MTSKQIASQSFVAIATTMLMTSSVIAQSYGTYGSGNGETPNDLTVNKKVYNPVKKEYTENLSVTDTLYKPGEIIMYEITVTNGSGETMNPVTVKDTLPPHTTFYSGPGVYNKNDNTVTFEEANMIAGAQKTYYLGTKVNAENLPTTTFCVTNTVRVNSPTRPNGDDDTAQACISATNAVATRLPTAGFNTLAMLVPSLAMGAIGMIMTKKNS